jgi:hypothetical protein
VLFAKKEESLAELGPNCKNQRNFC